jgi:hypothetical protein
MTKTILLLMLAILNILASILGMGLSAMASDDVSRAAEARQLQMLVWVWFVVSIATPVVAWMIGRKDARLGHLAYLPMVILAVLSIAGLALF